MLVHCKLVLVILPVALALRRPAGGFPSSYDASRIIFRDDDYETPDQVASGNSTVLTPPIELIKDLSRLDVNDLLLHYVDYNDSQEQDQGTFLSDRFGDDLERNSALTPKGAPCIPELTTVELLVSNDASEMYIPQCTRLERCGGCCQHRLLSCQPQQVELVNFQITKVKYTGGKKLKFMGKEVVTVERHTKCKCDCKLKAEECTRLQEYRSSECRCACANRDEQKKCEKEQARKAWDPDACACRCRSQEPCSTGDYFDQAECRCLRAPPRRRYAYYGFDPFECTRLQEYRSSECRCACANRDEQKKCEKEQARKAWDPDACACRCRSQEPCSTGDYFDQAECRCLRAPPRRRYAYYGFDPFANN